MTATPAAGPAPVSVGQRLSSLAAAHPEQIAILFVTAAGDEEAITWRALDEASNRYARLLAARGITEQSFVAIGLPNSPEHFYACFGTWKLGATPLPLRAALPDRERDAILDVARPAIVIADWPDLPYPTLDATARRQVAVQSAAALPDRVPANSRALASGGSTGRPKIILTPGAFAYPPGTLSMVLQPLGFRAGQTQLLAGPLYHAMPFVIAHAGLFEDQTLVLMERFDAARAVDLIARHHVQFLYLAPTMMRRITLLPDPDRASFASLEAVFSTAAPCPPWLKRAWIDLLGPERVYEFYAMSENIGTATIRGDEWLARPGSVGRPQQHDVRILDPAGNDLPPGEIGEIYLRPRLATGPTYHYIGSPPAPVTADGFTTVGDLGWLDADGYLYIADRRADLIITGGANVYAAEVEAALSESPEIADLAVIGLPDEEWGKRVHAVIQPRDPAAPPAIAMLDAHCRERLAAYKVPKSYEFISELPRTEAGKLRRTALVEERAAGWTTAMVAGRTDPLPHQQSGRSRSLTEQ